MCSLISWCSTCSDHTVLDPVPNAVSSEYACRRCDAAYLLEPEPLVVVSAPVPAAA